MKSLEDTRESFENAKSVVLWWALDMCRALYDRPFLARILLRPVIGKYAYNELMNMGIEIRKVFELSLGYGIEGAEYNKVKFPLDYREVWR